MRRDDLMTDYDLIFKEEFLKSKAYKEGYDSLSDILNFFREIFNPELKPELIKQIKKEQWSIK